MINSFLTDEFETLKDEQLATMVYFDGAPPLRNETRFVADEDCLDRLALFRFQTELLNALDHIEMTLAQSAIMNAVAGAIVGIPHSLQTRQLCLGQQHFDAVEERVVEHFASRACLIDNFQGFSKRLSHIFAPELIGRCVRGVPFRIEFTINLVKLR